MDANLAKKIAQIIKGDTTNSNQFSLEEQRKYFVERHRQRGIISYGAFHVRDNASEVSYWLHLQNRVSHSDVRLFVRKNDGTSPLAIIKETSQDGLEWQYKPHKKIDEKK